MLTLRRVAVIIALAFVVWVAYVVAVTELVYGATSYPCAGVPADAPVKAYPEPRLFLESQSWTEPQPARAGFEAFAGGQGHIHVGMCWPLLQHLAGQSIDFDVLVQAHERTQPVAYGLRLDAYPVLAWGDHISFGPPVCADGTPAAGGHCFQAIDCREETCAQWVHVEDYPLAAIPESGLRAFYAFVKSDWATGPPGANDWTYGSWWAYVDNDRPAGQPVGQTCCLSGESVYSTTADGGGKYARAFLPLADYPYDAATGELRPVPDRWEISPFEEGDTMRVLVDPALHANPPDLGTVVLLDTYPLGPLQIDTTKLKPGVHFLLVAAGKTGGPGKGGTKWWGVLRVPFLVAGQPDPPAPPTMSVAPERLALTYGSSLLAGDVASLAGDDDNSLDVRARVGTTGGWFAYYPTSRATVLYLKAAAGRPCSGTVAVGGGSGWATVAYVSLAPQWAMFDVPVPAGTSGVRLLCTSGDRPTISVEQAVLR